MTHYVEDWEALYGDGRNTSTVYIIHASVGSMAVQVNEA